LAAGFAYGETGGRSGSATSQEITSTKVHRSSLGGNPPLLNHTARLVMGELRRSAFAIARLVVAAVARVPSVDSALDGRRRSLVFREEW
jgi:hypothetical protein